MLKLSFILPCYNVAPYFGRCIESIEHQDIPQSEYEVICVDDCSKDNTVEVIKEYQKRYPNIRLICHTENKTAGGARNTAIDAAQGRYIWCVDPDDSIAPNVLKVLLSKAITENLEILFFNFTYIEENGNKRKEEYRYIDMDIVVSGQDFILSYCQQGMLRDITNHTCALFLRNYLEDKQIKYPIIRSSQDVIMIWNACLKASKVSSTSKVCYNIIRRANSTTGSQGKLYANNLISASLYYPYHIHQLKNQLLSQLNDKLSMNFDEQLSYPLNILSRRIFLLSHSELKRFYKELQLHSEYVDVLRPYMSRKTRHIFGYVNPFICWLFIIYVYKIKSLLVK